MAKNVFISFRFSDGYQYKNKLTEMFDHCRDTVDFSEDKDRSQMSDYTIQNYLYRKLKRSSVTIIILTPLALNHRKKFDGNYDDWMYDEIRYSLENRENNRTNGLIAVYTPEAENDLICRLNDNIYIKDVDNLFRKNVMNVKLSYKKFLTPGIFDRDYDSYCSLYSWDEFTNNIEGYISLASEKRDKNYMYNIAKRM